MSPNPVAGAYGGLGLDQVEDDVGTITREDFLARAANGNQPQPKPVKLCACGCGKPFEAKGAQKYVSGHAPGPTPSKKPRVPKADRPSANRPEPAGVGGPAPAGPGGRRLEAAEVARLVAELRRWMPGVTLEIFVGDVRLVVAP